MFTRNVQSCTCRTSSTSRGGAQLGGLEVTLRLFPPGVCSSRGTRPADAACINLLAFNDDEAQDSVAGSAVLGDCRVRRQGTSTSNPL